MQAVAEGGHERGSSAADSSASASKHESTSSAETKPDKPAGKKHPGVNPRDRVALLEHDASEVYTVTKYQTFQDIDLALLAEISNAFFQQKLFDLMCLPQILM